MNCYKLKYSIEYSFIHFLFLLVPDVRVIKGFTCKDIVWVIELKQLGSILTFILSESVRPHGDMNKHRRGRATISASQSGCAKGPGWLTARKHLMMGGKVSRSNGRQILGWSAIVDAHFRHCAHKQTDTLFGSTSG